MPRIVLWGSSKNIQMFVLKIVMFEMFMKSKRNSSFKEDWDWAPMQTMKLKKDLKIEKENS
jgi:hypothetical protein